MNHTHRHYRIPEPRPAALALAAATAMATATGWATTTHHLRQRTRELHNAQHDHVTGLLNRRAWEQAVHAMWQRSNPVGALGLVDLDDFKAINDQFGHHAGDQVLRATANRLAIELGSCGVIGRYGGDELAFLTAKASGVELSRLRACLCSTVPVAGIGHISVSAAVGMVSPPPGASLSAALATADEAMYTAKKRQHQRPRARGSADMRIPWQHSDRVEAGNVWPR
ncbi:GGDEF domain-containing protein [Saccharopolyspora sp. NPDC049426]|uniref:GGDEF domain-containing protein n=1 Tax=Saccharopolyspora sp. NPDC049426 TaxID=3155652 RepID=UPI003429766D